MASRRGPRLDQLHRGLNPTVHGGTTNNGFAGKPLILLSVSSVLCLFVARVSSWSWLGERKEGGVVDGTLKPRIQIVSCVVLCGEARRAYITVWKRLCKETAHFGTENCLFDGASHVFTLLE